MTKETKTSKGERIAKYLSRAGICSRRDAERLIADGLVKVDGRILETPAFLVTSKNRIVVDGQRVKAPEMPRLWRYHKPTGLVTSARDEKGRETVFEKLPNDIPRVMSVGRLDLSTEGLLLMTNDGGLKRYLELPSTGWARMYRARVFGKLVPEKLEELKEGVMIDGVDYGAMDVKIEREGMNSWLLVTIWEGKNREVRKVLESTGLEVNRLIRVSYGPFSLKGLDRGAIVEVKPEELKKHCQAYLDENVKDFDSQAAQFQQANKKRRPKASAEKSRKMANDIVSEGKPKKPAFDKKKRSFDGASSKPKSNRKKFVGKQNKKK